MKLGGLVIKLNTQAGAGAVGVASGELGGAIGVTEAVEGFGSRTLTPSMMSLI